MKRIAQSHALASISSRRFACLNVHTPITVVQRSIHTTPSKPANVVPITATGPPPSAPVPSAEHVDSRVARRRKQAELLKRGQDLRAVTSGTGGGTAKQKRFWKDVHVKQVDGRFCSSQSLSIHDYGVAKRKFV
jgi:ATP synthase F1 complex assembly factor 2